MSAQDKLLDVFSEWVMQGRRWPLLLLLLIPVWFSLFQNYYELEFREVFDLEAFRWAVGATVVFSLALYGACANLERLTYSFVNRLRGGDRVSITRPLAYHKLPCNGGGDTRAVSVVDEIAGMTTPLGIRPVVIPQPKTSKLPASPRDQFLLDGTISPLGRVIRCVVTLRDSSQAMEITNRLMEGVPSDPEDGERGRTSVPLHRILDGTSLIGMFLSELTIRAELPQALQVAMTRLFIRSALMTSLYRDGNTEAKRVAQTMLDIGELMSPLKNEQIARIYVATAFHLVTRDHDLGEALRALRVARKFSATDPTILALLLLLSLETNRLDAAGELLEELRTISTDRALTNWLAADYLMACGKPGQAVPLFEEALEHEASEKNRSTIHFNAAFAYAMANELNAREQGNGMIRHMEDAVQTSATPVHFILKAYGWALRGDARQFMADYAKAVALADAWAGTQEGTKAFIENWRGRGLLKLRMSSQVADSILNIVGSPEESDDVANLTLLAQAALDLAGIRGDPDHLNDAERYLNRILALEPRNGEATKLRATVHAVRAENTQDKDERMRLREKARGDFLRSIRDGHELPASHAVLARLYESADDPVNAAKHRRRWLELSPDDPDAAAYQALTLFEDSGELADAMAHLAEFEGRSREVGKVYRLLAARAIQVAKEDDPEWMPLWERCRECLVKAIQLGDDEGGTVNLLENVLRDLAVGYQRSGRCTEAMDTYASLLEIDPTSYLANNNLAFLLFDQDRDRESLEHWERALEASPDDADASAGRAAALHSLGRDDEARASYAAAVAANRDFLDEHVLRDKYLWSDKAIAAVTMFMEELREDAGE